MVGCPAYFFNDEVITEDATGISKLSIHCVMINTGLTKNSAIRAMRDARNDLGRAFKLIGENPLRYPKGSVAKSGTKSRPTQPNTLRAPPSIYYATEGPAVDATGMHKWDIDMVISLTGVPRNGAIRALRDSDLNVAGAFFTIIESI